MEKPDNCEIDDYESYLSQNIRHELIHAFLDESGLETNWHHLQEWGHDETVVDWFAIQIPKIETAWKHIIEERKKENDRSKC